VFEDGNGDVTPEKRNVGSDGTPISMVTLGNAFVDCLEIGAMKCSGKFREGVDAAHRRE
jgi:hypothetical protein